LRQTVFTTAQAGMWITPHNYLKSQPAMQSTQQLYIELNEEGTAEGYDTFGHDIPDGLVDVVSAVLSVICFVHIQADVSG
jgi:hypothetical protein